MRKVIVAGAGHGGIATASVLARRGFDVTVCERNQEGKLGYDWTDIFDMRSITYAGLKMPPADKFELKGDVTFYGPSENTAFVQRSPQNQHEIKMERSDIYEMLIFRAVECGVKFRYGVNIDSAITENDRVVGINTDKGEFRADLVIDACGCDSPVRRSLPRRFGVQNEMGEYEKFYVYRAYFNKTIDGAPKDDFKLTLLPHGEKGISWVKDEVDLTDVLVGRFIPFSEDEALKSIDIMRQNNGNIGTEIKRGGSFAKIPVRQPLSLMVADGYVAVGDSAFMTVPLIGSGIANALKASKMLANAIIADMDDNFDAKTLWRYQREYFLKIGSINAPLACLKNLLTGVSPQQLDEVFDKDIPKIRSKVSSIQNERASDIVKQVLEILVRLKNAVTDRDLAREIGKSIKEIVKLEIVLAQIPRDYSEFEVKQWAQKYDAIFR